MFVASVRSGKVIRGCESHIALTAQAVSCSHITTSIFNLNYLLSVVEVTRV